MTTSYSTSNRLCMSNQRNKELSFYWIKAFFNLLFQSGETRRTTVYSHSFTYFQVFFRRQTVLSIKPPDAAILSTVFEYSPPWLQCTSWRPWFCPTVSRRLAKERLRIAPPWRPQCCLTDSRIWASVDQSKCDSEFGSGRDGVPKEVFEWATPCFRSPCNEQQCPQPSPAFLSHLVPSPACVGTAVAARRPFPPSSHSWAWECFNAPDVRGVARQSHEDWQRSVWGLHLPDVHGIILSGPGKRIAVSVSAHYAPIFQFLLYQCNISWDSSPP